MKSGQIINYHTRYYMMSGRTPYEFDVYGVGRVVSEPKWWHDTHGAHNPYRPNAQYPHNVNYAYSAYVYPCNGVQAWEVDNLPVSGQWVTGHNPPMSDATISLWGRESGIMQVQSLTAYYQELEPIHQFYQDDET